MAHLNESGSPIPMVAPRPFVSKDLFLGIVWGGLAICTLTVAARFLVRYTSWKRLLLHDIFVFFAWLLMLAGAILWQLCQDGMFKLSLVSSGIKPELALDPDWASDVEYFLKGSAVYLVFLYTGLWSIKLSFLIFFRQLGNHIRVYRVLWWAITILTGCTWVVCIGTIPYRCFGDSILVITTHCSEGAAVDYQNAVIAMGCAFDVGTDILIMILPFTLLWKIKVSLKRKLALAGIFSLVVITIVVAIVRVTLVVGRASNLSNTDQVELTWLHFWSIIEFIVALAIVCLGSFRALFLQNPTRNNWQDEQQRIQASNARRGRTEPANCKAKASLFSRSLLDTLATTDESTQYNSSLASVTDVNTDNQRRFARDTRYASVDSITLDRREQHKPAAI